MNGPSFNDTELNFLQQNYGNPGDSIYGLAMGPYFGLATGIDAIGASRLFRPELEGCD
jgi:hypothetical protein